MLHITITNSCGGGDRWDDEEEAAHRCCFRPDGDPACLVCLVTDDDAASGASRNDVARLDTLVTVGDGGAFLDELHAADKLRARGWKLPLTFEDSRRKTISGTLANPSWLDVESFKGMPRADDAPPIVRTAGAGVTAAIKAKL